VDVGGQLEALSALTKEKSLRYTQYKTLGGPHSRSRCGGEEEKIPFQ